ncbi:MAG: TonB C-terminal domain-containing protein [Terriglobales bacterium]
MPVQRTRAGGSGGLLGSLVLHGALAGLVVYGAWLGKFLPLGGAHPGTAAPGSIQANLVASVPGGAIPMPSPVLTPTKNRLASDLEAEGVSRPRPLAAARRSIALPAYKPEDLARKQALADLRKLAQADRQKNDPRVPQGTGGKVSIGATSSAQGTGGGGGMSFGDANFGNLYADWVNRLRDRLQFYWNQQPRDPTLPAGAKVTVTLTVHRSGLIDSIHYISRSGSLEVNNMAFQSVRQLAAAEQFPLPPGYAPSSLTVSVVFELN